MSTSFNLNLSASVTPRVRKSFPTPLVNAAKASLSIEEHQVGDFFTISETSSEWVTVRTDLDSRETALCTMLLASLALSADAEVVRVVYNCTTLPLRGEKAIISIGFNVAFGEQEHAKKDVERVNSVRNEKLQVWRSKTAIGATTPTTTTSTTTEKGEGSVEL